MTNQIGFTWPQRYRGMTVAEIDANAYVELVGDDYYLRITFNVLGSDIDNPAEIEVYGPERDAIIRFLNSHRGYAGDIADIVRDQQSGRISAHRELAVAE